MTKMKTVGQAAKDRLKKIRENLPFSERQKEAFHEWLDNQPPNEPTNLRKFFGVSDIDEGKEDDT